MAPEHNARGLFAIGPQFITPSDVLAKLMAEQHCPITSATPENERRQHVTYTARRRQYQQHGRTEFLAALRVA